MIIDLTDNRLTQICNNLPFRKRRRVMFKGFI